MTQRRQEDAGTIVEMRAALMQVRQGSLPLMSGRAKKWDDIDEAVEETSPASVSSAKY